MQFLPVSATETVIREISYALPDERREMKAARHLNWRINRRVNAEDTELITRVQLGMQSPAYVAGPLGTSEVCLRSFAKKLRRLIPEARLELPPPPGWAALELTRCMTSVDRYADRQQHQRPSRSASEPGAVEASKATNTERDR